MPIAAAIIGGAAALGGALISSYAVGSAAGAATDAAAADNALETRTYDSNRALATPYIDAGSAADRELEGFLGLGGDPAASQAALNTYLNATGYRFDLDQGLDAVTQGKAAAGLLNSGATLKALDSYATGEANRYGQQYAQDLAGVAGTGENAVGALTGAGQAYAGQVSQNNNGAAEALGNAAIAGANIDTSLIGNALSAYALARGQSSFGGGASGGFNAFAPGG